MLTGKDVATAKHQTKSQLKWHSQLPRVYAVPWPDPLALVSAFEPNNLIDSCCFKCNFKKSLIIYEPNSLLKHR